jgi:excinuclease UvrABC ATPase subunit
MGPRAGSEGGRVVYEGTYAGLQKSKTLTAQFLLRNVSKDEFRKAKGRLPIKDARVNNLQDVSVDIPVGVLTVITGVAGSGKMPPGPLTPSRPRSEMTSPFAFAGQLISS